MIAVLVGVLVGVLVALLATAAGITSASWIVAAIAVAVVAAGAHRYVREH